MELVSLARLERSHRRHDHVMASLLEAARRLAAGRPDEGDVATVHEAVAYFERAVTRHFLDEEGSVFPRLSTRRPALAAELAALSAEHPTQIQMQGAVAAAAREMVDGEARPNAGKVLLDAATRLAEAHVTHVGREDAIFQIAQSALTAEDDTEIVAEMETRRDREFDEHDRGGGGGRGGGGRGGGGGGGGGGRGRAQGELAQVAPTLRTRAPTVSATPSAKARAAKVTAKPPAAKRGSAKTTRVANRAPRVAKRNGAAKAGPNGAIRTVKSTKANKPSGGSRSTKANKPTRAALPAANKSTARKKR